LPLSTSSNSARGGPRALIDVEPDEAVLVIERHSRASTLPAARTATVRLPPTAPGTSLDADLSAALAALGGAEFDWVIASDVIDEAHDAAAALQAIAAVLAPGGRLVVRVAAPSPLGCIARAFGGAVRAALGRKPLRAMGERAGLRLVACRRVDGRMVATLADVRKAEVADLPTPSW
jgi:SAM-dependent methyltransferase